VSRHHCVFTVDDFTVRLRDLGSTNGTFVNGERIQGQVVLKAGDHVVVGKLSFEMVVRQAAEVAASKRAATGGPEAPPDFPATEPVQSPDSSETAALNAAETMEFPVPEVGDDTAVMPNFSPTDAAAQQGVPPQGYMPAGPYGAPAYGMPPG